MCMGILPSCMSVRHGVPHTLRGQERAPGPLSIVFQTAELTCGCRELNPATWEEQSVLLATEPSLQPQLFLFFFLTGFLCVCV